MSHDTVRQLHLVLESNPDSDQEELAALTLDLHEQLLGLEVEHVELSRLGKVPAGAKPGDVIAIGGLAVTMAPFALRPVLNLLEAWLGSRPIRAATIKIGEDSLELQAVSSADQQKLIDAFVAAHGSTLSPAVGSRPSSEPDSSGAGET